MTSILGWKRSSRFESQFVEVYPLSSRSSNHMPHLLLVKVFLEVEYGLVKHCDMEAIGKETAQLRQWPIGIIGQVDGLGPRHGIRRLNQHDGVGRAVWKRGEEA